ncbi:Hypothetical predicted protein, partial [Paramuricea clavata]
IYYYFKNGYHMTYKTTALPIELSSQRGLVPGLISHLRGMVERVRFNKKQQGYEEFDPDLQIAGAARGQQELEFKQCLKMRILHGGAKIRLLSSSGENNIFRTSTAIPNRTGPSCSIHRQRDTRLSYRKSLGRYLSNIKWSTLSELSTCDEMLSHFIGLVSNGVNSIIPKKYVKVRANEPPWITSKFKSLLKKRQDALANNNK